MEAIEALLLDWYPLASESWSYLHPRGILTGHKPGSVATQFAKRPRIFYIRRDNGNPLVVVNVFGEDGTALYSIERKSRYSTLWTIYKANTRIQIARIKCGLFTRSIVFSNKPGLKTRQIGEPRWLYGGLPSRTFYSLDGAPHAWRYNSQYLEKIVNPGGGTEEVRHRFARIRLLRSNRFNWELSVDPTFDEEIALATGFISLLTQWSTARSVIPGSRSVL